MPCGYADPKCKAQQAKELPEKPPSQTGCRHRPNSNPVIILSPASVRQNRHSVTARNKNIRKRNRRKQMPTGTARRQGNGLARFAYTVSSGS